MDNLREVSSWSIDLPSKANFSLPLNVDVLVASSYEILFCSRFDNLKFDKFSPLFVIRIQHRSQWFMDFEYLDCYNPCAPMRLLCNIYRRNPKNCRRIEIFRKDI